MKVRISLNGCDDTTYVEADVTPGQLALLHNLAEWSEAASSYGCQPTLGVRVTDAEGDRG